jgi:hypothetical protein
MDNLVAKWKNSVEGSKLRQKERKKVQKTLLNDDPDPSTYITDQAQRIIDILFPKEPPHHSKFNKLCEILSEVHGAGGPPVDRGESSTSQLLSSLE